MITQKLIYPEIIAGGVLVGLSIVMLATVWTSYFSNYQTTVLTNTYGEFWLDVVTLLGCCVLGGYVTAVGLSRVNRKTEMLPVSPSIRRLLDSRFPDAKSYDEMLLELLEANPPDSFWDEIDDRRLEPSVPAPDVYRDLGL